MTSRARISVALQGNKFSGVWTIVRIIRALILLKVANNESMFFEELRFDHFMMLIIFALLPFNFDVLNRQRGLYRRLILVRMVADNESVFV